MEIEMKSHVFSFEMVSLSPRFVVVCHAAVVSAVEMKMRNRAVLFEEVSQYLHSVVLCSSAVFVVTMEMKSHVVSSEIFLVLAVAHVLGLCLFCCGQGFLSVLVTSLSLPSFLDVPHCGHTTFCLGIFLSFPPLHESLIYSAAAAVSEGIDCELGWRRHSDACGSYSEVVSDFHFVSFFFWRFLCHLMNCSQCHSSRTLPFSFSSSCLFSFPVEGRVRGSQSCLCLCFSSFSSSGSFFDQGMNLNYQT